MPQRYSADEVPVQPVVPRVGVLLANLGTPDAPTPDAVRRFLAEFLADPLVIDLPRWLWLPLLHGVILRTRPKRAAAAYAKVWTLAGSPLLVESQAQAEGLELELVARLKSPVRVALGMRYGTPTIASAVADLKQRGVERLVVLPMYPQYSRTTTSTTHAAVDAAMGALGWEPRTTRVLGWHDAPGYIAALAASVRQHWQRHGRGAKLLISFHGLPARYVAAGDPYAQQCAVTAKLLAEALDLQGARWAIAYQSRVGFEPWLSPYTDRVLKGWAAERVGDVDVICPGFSVDCLETLEEIALANAEAYRELGGGTLRYVPALNSNPDHLAFLAELVAARVRG